MKEFLLVVILLLVLLVTFGLLGCNVANNFTCSDGYYYELGNCILINAADGEEGSSDASSSDDSDDSDACGGHGGHGGHK